MGLRQVFLGIAVLGLALRAAPAWAAGCTIGKMADIPITMRGLKPTATAQINGVEDTFVVDSGAFFSSLTPGAVERFHLRTREAPPNLIVRGIGGRANVLLTTADSLTFGGLTYHRPDFLVTEKGLAPGTMGLLGANLMVKADIEYDLANGVIRLFHPEGCDKASLAYWAGDKPVSVIDIEPTAITDPHLRGVASVNGAKVRVIFDTGSPVSMLELSAAARAGVTPQTPGVREAGFASGVGQRSFVEQWIGPFASFKIGDEEVKNTKLRFGRMDFDDRSNMLLGADFFLSHRIYVSRSQHKLYFTYNGGSVFNLGVAPQTVATNAAAPPAAGATADPYANTPTDAAGFARRAAAFAGRREFTPAIDDLTKAIALDPASADYLYRRALARFGARQPLLAMVDLNQALKLKPDDIPALLARAEFLTAAKRPEDAKKDLAMAETLVVKEPSRRLGLAVAYQRAGMWAESIGELDQWIAANPKADNLPQGLNARCWARAMLGQDLDKALADCNAALRLLPDDPGFLDSRALVHLRRGEFARGISDYEAVLKLQPNNVWALYGRGWGRLKLGNKDGDADIKAAITLAPRLAEQAKARGLAL
jgi:tetratricopeptide (TPR) repeat protein